MKFQEWKEAKLEEKPVWGGREGAHPGMDLFYGKILLRTFAEDYPDFNEEIEGSQLDQIFQDAAKAHREEHAAHLEKINSRRNPKDYDFTGNNITKEAITFARSTEAYENFAIKLNLPVIQKSSLEKKMDDSKKADGWVETFRTKYKADLDGTCWGVSNIAHETASTDAILAHARKYIFFKRRTTRILEELGVDLKTGQYLKKR